jgi:hypothetical protein
VTSRRASAREALATIGRALASETPPVVFVGGTVTALYPLEGGVDVRPTVDVDCVVDLATTAEYYAFIGRLRRRGFTECTDEGAPLCRLTYAGIRVDIVATADTGLGPTNRWYREAVLEAAVHPLAEDLDIRAIAPVFFVATKLEAFRGRGRGDYLASHDIEDTLTVLAGLPALREQIAHETTSVAREVRAELVALRDKEAFIDAVPAHFDGDDVGQARADEVLAWLASLRAP